MIKTYKFGILLISMLFVLSTLLVQDAEGVYGILTPTNAGKRGLESNRLDRRTAILNAIKRKLYSRYGKDVLLPKKVSSHILTNNCSSNREL